MRPSILVFAGSARATSVNKRLARQAATTARQMGQEAIFIDLNDFPMPLYDGDLERKQGVPEQAQSLATLIEQHDILLLASPEYNGAFTSLLKNSIDWVSRASRRPLAGKVVGLMSATPGPGGGSRGLALLRRWLENMRATVPEASFSLPRAGEAFQDDGTLPPPLQAELKSFVQGVVQTKAEQQRTAA